MDIWSGIILVVESSEKSIEPNYKRHKIEENTNFIQKLLLLLGGVATIGLTLYQNHIFQNWGLVLLLILNLAGLYIGGFLIQKQINPHNNIADKVCSSFAKSRCNDILKQPAAKFMGIIGWSEVGICYFFSNIFLLLYTPYLLPYLSLVLFLTLPYSFWSIWYQKFKAKIWCPLCLIVQLLFWLLLITNLIFNLIQIPNFKVLDILSVGLIYGIPLLLLNLFLPYQTVKQELIKTTQQFNRLKMNEQVFLGLLKEQIYYNVDKGISSITLGNPDAKNMITVLLNPHCNPCAKVHKKIQKLLEDTNSKFYVQYVLSSFDYTLDSSCEFFIYINERYSAKERNRIYDVWFEEGKYDKENFFRKYSFVNDNSMSEEYLKHLKWKELTKLNTTPTLLFGGFELPEIYSRQIENISFFTDLEIDPKYLVKL